MSHGSFHKLGDLTRRTVYVCVVILCEDTNKTYGQFKCLSSLEEDYSVKEVVIEPLIGALPFTFIRLIDTDETERYFCFVLHTATSQFPRQGKPPIGREINIT